MRGLEGNTMAQPRVYGHDAKAIVIGAINTSESNNGFTFVGGTAFVAGDVGSTITAATGGATFEITELIDNGAILGLKNINPGSGYTVGTSINLNGGTGSGASFIPTNIDIPNTQQRGCVVYNGNAAQTVSLVTEAGGEAVDFPLCQPGKTVGDKSPILAKRITAGSNLVAVY
tara:strand:- start:936 stop:1454 length:519 start_codon:yes stop_codon:yes gene_type:complete